MGGTEGVVFVVNERKAREWDNVNPAGVTRRRSEVAPPHSPRHVRTASSNRVETKGTVDIVTVTRTCYVYTAIHASMSRNHSKVMSLY